MPEYIKRSSPLFLSTCDEETFSTRLRVLIPDVVFVDGQRWSTAAPPACPSISECSGRLVYIWSPKVCPSLPFKALADGVVQGPSSGIVVQLGRSRYVPNVLLSGDIGVGYIKGHHDMAGMVAKVWNTLGALNCASLDSVNPATGEIIARGIKNYIVGPHAKELSDKGTLLKHSDVEIYYRAEGGIGARRH